MTVERQTIVVGAGIAGLSFARAIRQRGHDAVRVLDRSRGVGGRCATRRIEGLVVDHGLPFFHGSDAALRELVVASGEARAWPQQIEGRGRPCQPRAFARNEWRLALADGVTALPKMLAAGSSIELNAEVKAIDAEGKQIVLHTARETYRADDVVLALAHPQLLRLLPEWADLITTRRLLEQVASIATLAAIALYPAANAPPWQMLYPEDSAIIQAVSHDSSKRADAARLALVVYAQPRWSAAQLDAEPQRWGAELLAELGRLIGPFAARPRAAQFHRWRYARVGRQDEFARPLLLTLANGARLGIIGELFAPGGGIQAAFRSGIALARMLSPGG